MVGVIEAMNRWVGCVVDASAMVLVGKRYREESKWSGSLSVRKALVDRPGRVWYCSPSTVV